MIRRWGYACLGMFNRFGICRNGIEFNEQTSFCSIDLEKSIASFISNFKVLAPLLSSSAI